MSYVTIKKSVAQDLAAAKLTYIIRRRSELRAAWLRREVELANKPTFWSKLFKRPEVIETDIIAREEAAEYPIENTLWIIGQTFEDLENLCFAVQSACRIGSDDTIHLSIQDAEKIQ